MIKRRVYTKEFKIEAVELTLDSTKTVKEISEDLGVPYHYYANGGASTYRKAQIVFQVMVM